MNKGLLAAILLLAGCAAPEPEKNGRPPEQPDYHYIAQLEFGKLKKICDHGRAIYIADYTYRGVAITAVADAKECQQ